MSELFQPPFVRSCQLLALTDPNCTFGLQATSLINRVCKNRHTRSRRLDEAANGLAWIIVHCNEVVAVFSLGEAQDGVIYLEHAVIREDFRFHGINCLATPMQVCAAVMAAPGGTALRLVMHAPLDPDDAGWLELNHFRPCPAFYDLQAQRPFWEFTEQGLVKAAHQIAGCVETLRLYLRGTVGSLAVDIRPKGTPFAASFQDIFFDRLARGELSIMGWPDLDVIEAPTDFGRCAV